MHIFIDADACPVVGIVEKISKEIQSSRHLIM